VPLYFERVLDHEITGLEGLAGFVIDIPTEGFEEFIEEFMAQLGFVVPVGLVFRLVFAELLDELMDDLRGGQGFPPGRTGAKGIIPLILLVMRGSK
jgi:hypothetical protein